jgi:hypothetical protein
MNSTDKKPSNEKFFNAQEMQARVERLKAEGKLPPLADLLETVRRVAAEHRLEQKQKPPQEKRVNSAADSLKWP